ncbi:MAG TPA: hypothetical protein VD736_07820 [Nitrososphaera sp.]|nr:hypothetical protein [Nitrososphaera sp.]
MYRPKSTRDIYVESLSVNSTSLEKQLAEQSVPPREIKSIMAAVSRAYNENVDRIVKESDREVTALERVPSPLKLFIDCLADAQKSMNLSEQSRALIERYTSAWEDWM